MPLPLAVPIVLGVAALVGLYEITKKKPASGAPGTPAPGTPTNVAPDLPGVGPGSTSDTAYRQIVHNAAMDLAANGTDPDQMDAAANEIAPYGFTTEAAALHARAAELRASPPAQPVAPIAPAPNLPPLPLTPVVQPAPPVLAPQYATVTGQPGTNIRSTPDSSSPGNIVRGVNYGDTVTIQNWNGSPDGQWAQVSSPAQGYMNKGYIKAQGAPATPAVIPASATVTGSPQATVTASKLNVHATPSSTGQILGGVSQGQVVNIVNGSNPSWLQIYSPSGLDVGGNPTRTTELTGWASRQYLQLTPGSDALLSGGGTPSLADLPPNQAQALMDQGYTSTSGNGSGDGALDGQGRIVHVAAPGGARLRHDPRPDGKVMTLIPAGWPLTLRRLVPGPKGSPLSRGPGGWALVAYCERQDLPCMTGWVPSEWLSMAS